MDCETIDLTTVHEEAGLSGVFRTGKLDDTFMPCTSTARTHACGSHAAICAKDLCELTAVDVCRQVLNKHSASVHLLLSLAFTAAVAVVVAVALGCHRKKRNNFKHQQE